MSGETSEALVRARHMQEWLGNMAREEDPWRSHFFAALPEDVALAIETAARTDWVPARFHALFADLVAAAFGPVRSHDYYRRAFARALRGPFWNPVVRTGMRLLGVTPASFLRWAGRGWESSFRNCGSMHGQVLEPSRGRLLYENLPPVLTASEPWLDSSQGSVYGVFDLCGVTGVVRLDKSRCAQGVLRLELEWTERG
jgi:hypothetical protein